MKIDLRRCYQTEARRGAGVGFFPKEFIGPVVKRRLGNVVGGSKCRFAHTRFLPGSVQLNKILVTGFFHPATLATFAQVHNMGLVGWILRFRWARLKSEKISQLGERGIATPTLNPKSDSKPLILMHFRSAVKIIMYTQS
jgi:hypothetical protein